MPPILEEPDQDGTIIVKGKYRWLHPASPESTTTEIRPMGANPPSQANTPQHLESPEPLEEGTSTPNPDPERSNSRLDLPEDNTPNKRQRYNGTTMEERLQMMPEKRAMPWRPGVEPGAELETGGESRRKQIRFGCLLATRGDVVPVPCNSCANGRGKFKVCVALDGYFKGACASCQLSGRPNRCSIKKNDDVKLDLDSPTTDTAAADVSHSNGKHHSSAPGPQAKRRRTDIPPDWENARPVWEHELGVSQASQPINEIVQRPWATVNPPVSTPTAQMISDKPSDPRSVLRSNERSSSMGWVTVNQPASAPVARPLKNGMESNGNTPRTSLDQEVREGTVLNDEGGAALIDTLPKNKQRHIYGLVSGLQGGIEHLQRELDALKKALGIDDE